MLLRRYIYPFFTPSYAGVNSGINIFFFVQETKRYYLTPSGAMHCMLVSAVAFCCIIQVHMYCTVWIYSRTANGEDHTSASQTGQPFHYQHCQAHSQAMSLGPYNFTHTHRKTGRCLSSSRDSRPWLGEDTVKDEQQPQERGRTWGVDGQSHSHCTGEAGCVMATQETEHYISKYSVRKVSLEELRLGQRMDGSHQVWLSENAGEAGGHGQWGGSRTSWVFCINRLHKRAKPRKKALLALWRHTPTMVTCEYMHACTVCKRYVGYAYQFSFLSHSLSSRSSRS